MIDYRYLSIANDTHAATAKARAIVMEIERNLGFEPTDREYKKLGYDIGNGTCCVHYVRQPFHCEPPFTKKFMMPFISVIVQGRQ